MYKHTIKIAVLVIVLCFGFFLAKVYQPAGRTVRIYKNALKDYDNENFSNSYYLFSRVGYLSNLKPAALYRQALCAKALGDKKTELKCYRKLIKLYPGSKLSMEARYQAAQLMIDTNPKLAYRYFKAVSKSNLDEDYKIASAFYVAKIRSAGKTFSKKGIKHQESVEIEDAFRKYLEHAPDGRLAVNVAKSWQRFNPNLTDADSVLVARAYYLASMYEEVLEVLKNVNPKLSWGLAACADFAQNNQDKALKSVETGVLKYSDFVSDEDYRMAVDTYLKSAQENEQYSYISKLFTLAKGKNKDYVWNLKCSLSPDSEKVPCYNSLYSNYPDGEFAEAAFLELFQVELKNKNYAAIKNLAHDYKNRFPDSESAAEVMFWAAKVNLKYSRKADAINIFNEIINKFPDSYYAYRAFWILKGISPAVIKASLEYKPVVYPYKYPSKGDIMHTLLSVDDYDMIAKFSNDEFIKSWVEYKKGHYSESSRMARDAMAKLKEKPVKGDLRWRLVYPQNYYIQVHRYAAEYNNNDALIMSIIREESYFNSEAQSGVGAIGL
ncbi:MAG: tetratricopeptide repeat protein, partial [Muribaculaceae bacterium]|nr:tetratricopeptide repeat protein [Muribaculaceae bacterium]